jgi:hypothetical protein
MVPADRLTQVPPSAMARPLASAGLIGRRHAPAATAAATVAGVVAGSPSRAQPAPAR